MIPSRFKKAASLYLNLWSSLLNFIYLYQQVSKMLGKAYDFTKDCCGNLVFKSQQLQVRIAEGAGVQAAQGQNSTMNQLYAKPGGGSGELLHTGKLFFNRYIPYCLGIPYPGFSTFSYEVELNNERVAEARIPWACPHYGPFAVTNKQNEQIGELSPSCYICKIWGWDWLYPCPSLTVKDQNMRELYKIQKVCCTCFCCTKWIVMDALSVPKSEITQTGILCPHYTVNFPDEVPNNKILFLGAMGLLP